MSEIEISESALERDLDRTLLDVVRLHADEPSQYYFGIGSPEGCAQARAVLALFRLLSRSRTDTFFEDERAIPVHELFERIKSHVSQIRHLYITQEEKLIHLFIHKILPQNPNPLRFIVLSSMSLFTCRVYLHPKEMQPDPIQAYVDGFFNLVIDLTDNIVRIPLIPKKSQENQSLTSATLPPSLRFKGLNENDEKLIREFIFDIAPKNGRKTQFSAFISVINEAHPVVGFVDALRAALTSIDLSFSIALCTLVHEPDDFDVIGSLLNVFVCDNRIDFFFRALSCSALRFVQSSQPLLCTEIVALANIVITQSFKWSQNISPAKGIPGLIEAVCNGMKNHSLSEFSFYALKTALVVAAYSDKSGLAAIAMFLEITVRPFASMFNIIGQFDAYKRAIIMNDNAVASLRKLIETNIVGFFTDEVIIKLKPRDIDFGIRDIYDFIQENIDDFINMVIFLNDRKKADHPAIQMMMFAYDMCTKHGII